MGSADVVPGVSGGTMALILGIYEELIMSIRMIGERNFWRAVLGLRIGEALKLLNWKFLASVFVGIFAAILTLAPVIGHLLENEPIIIWSFFFGLIVASVIVVGRRIERWSGLTVAALAAGTVAAFWIVGQVPAQTPNDPWFLVLSGALASSAMLLPGISGALILLLLGKYAFVIEAVNSRDIVSLGLIAVGATVGLVTLAQILAWLFKRYHDLTVAVLIGFMAGSLRKIWPWKEVVATTVDRHGEEVPLVLSNVLPPAVVNGAIDAEILSALAAALVGFTAVILLGWKGTRTAKVQE
jgi:putative membrane protein